MKYAVSFTKTFIVEADDKDDAIFKANWIYCSPTSIRPTITVKRADKNAKLSKDGYTERCESRGEQW
jgi:hypothetical protein